MHDQEAHPDREGNGPARVRTGEANDATTATTCSMSVGVLLREASPVTGRERPATDTPPVGHTVYPAKRNPDGYVAQRIGPADAERPWALTSLGELDQVQLDLLTDADVADWAPLHDELSDDGDSELDTSYAWAAPRLAKMHDEISEAARLPVGTPHADLVEEIKRLRGIAENEGAA